jgi:hypothetical protein
MTCNTQVAKYSSYDMNVLFNTSGQVSGVGYEMLSITSGEDQIFLYGTDMFINEYNTYYDLYGYAIQNCIFWSVIFVLMFFCMDYYMTQKREKKYNEKPVYTMEEKILAVGLVVIFTTAALIALFSQNYAHNDEHLFRMAIDYFLGQWRYPYGNSSWMAGTWSTYGANRLKESTFYYLVAGKVGWLFRNFFGLKRYYRMLNLICLGILLYICWIKRKTHKWMSVIIALSPQIWYTFSYASSDAWDMFWASIVVYLLLSTNGALYKAISLEKRYNWGAVLGYIIISAFAFMQLFLGKSNYLIILAIAFIDLLIYWFKNGNKVRRLFRYALIVAVTLLMFIAKKNESRVESVYYSNETVMENLEEQNYNRATSWDEYETGDAKELSDMSCPAKQGETFMYMLMEWGYMPTIPLIYNTAVGFYRWDTVSAGTLYRVIIMSLQLAMMIFYLKYLFKDRRMENIIQTITSTGLIIALFIVELLYCYYVTYQPQGRYMLPAFFVAGYMCARNYSVLESKGFQVCKYLCMYVGIYSFTFVGCVDLLTH